jgi:hypothetical protein
VIPRSVLACLLAFQPGLVETDNLKFVQYPLIHKVSCDEGSGTGFRVGLHHWLSVAHVTAMHNCEVDGAKIAVTEQDGKRDFSRFDTEQGAPNGFRVDCSGFVPGQWYFAIGHALGKPYQTLIPLYATYAKGPDGKRVLLGEYDVIPGMSGGPILNAEGEVVGTINAYMPGTPISLSRELRDTSICGATIA